MPHIHFEFPIRASLARVFGGVSTPEGFDQWWTLRSAGKPTTGTIFVLDFGPGYFWRARVLACDPPRAFELEFSEALPEWLGTRVRFDLAPIDKKRTNVNFSHSGWKQETGHYRGTAFSWAMYLRILRRALEHGETVPFERRLDV